MIVISLLANFCLVQSSTDHYSWVYTKSRDLVWNFKIFKTVKMFRNFLKSSLSIVYWYTKFEDFNFEKKSCDNILMDFRFLAR